MANVKYYLDKGNILLSYYVKAGDIVRLSLKEKVDPKHWDKKKYRVKYSDKNANAINTMLDDITTFVKETRIQYKIKGKYFDGNTLKTELKSRLFGDSSTVFDDYCTNIFLPDKVSKVSIAYYDTLVARIALINKYLPGLKFTDINRATCIKLEKAMIDKGNSKNYIHVTFRMFHEIINNAYIDEIHQNKYFMKDSFVPSGEAVDNIYNTIDDLDKIYNAIPSLKGNMKLAAIVYLRGCYSGQRFQSYRNMKPTMIYEINGIKMINLKQGKTQNNVSIPLSDKMKDVMSMPAKLVTRDILVRNIRILCERLGIPNASQISTHTARRTFATNMVLAGVDISKIMKITGHKTEKEFRKYVKIDGVQSAISVIDEVNKVFGAL